MLKTFRQMFSVNQGKKAKKKEKKKSWAKLHRKFKQLQEKVVWFLQVILQHKSISF